MDEETYNKLFELDARLRDALDQHDRNMKAIATQHQRNLEDLRNASARRQIGLSTDMNSNVEQALLAARDDADDVEGDRHREEMTRLSAEIWQALPQDWVDLRTMVPDPTDT